jgi:hypothetical protein
MACKKGTTTVTVRRESSIRPKNENRTKRRRRLRLNEKEITARGQRTTAFFLSS